MDNTMEARIIPQDIDAEKAVLGAILIDENVINDIITILNENDFYLPAHRKIYHSIIELYRKNEPIDYLTATNELRRAKAIDNIGGATYLTSLTEILPNTSNAKNYAKIVSEKSILRQLISRSTDIINVCYSQTLDADDILDDAEKKIFDISEKRITGGLTHISDVMSETLEMLGENKGLVSGVHTGFKELDQAVSGFQKGQLIILAARPGVGKSALALNIATNAALETDTPVAIFSYEMTKSELAQRLICSEARVNLTSLRRGYISKKDFEKLSYAMSKLSQAPIFVDDNVEGTVLSIRAKARRLMAKEGLGLIIIDYLHMMRGFGRFENKQQEISSISRELKLLAMELQVPVLALSQLSREPEKRPDHKPILSDLRESGSLEQDADVVLFIYRPEIYAKDEEERTKSAGFAHILVAKQRSGPAPIDVKLTFVRQYTRFENPYLNTETDET